MKTQMFSDEIPIKSLKMFKYALMLHFFFLSLIIVKSEICRISKFEGEHFDLFDTKVDYISNLYSVPMIVVYLNMLMYLVFYIY